MIADDDRSITEGLSAILRDEGYEVAVAIDGQKALDQLTAEAQQCIGQEAGFVGESAVQATVEPGIPPDPSGWDAPGANVVVTPPLTEPPSCVSCIM